MAAKLKVDPAGLESARTEFEHYQRQVEAIRIQVSRTLPDLGAEWQGDARRAYEATIERWVSDYNQTVGVPLEHLFQWFGSAIRILREVEDVNTK